MSGTKNTVLEQLLGRAIAYHRNGQLTAAELLYRQLLKMRADHVEAKHLFGILRFQQGRPSEALELIGAALKRKPHHAAAFYNRGNILAQLKRYAEALASFERALALDADSVDGFVGAADAALALCDFTRTRRIEGELRCRIEGGKPSVGPFTLLGYCDDPALQLRGAQGYVADKFGG